MSIVAEHLTYQIDDKTILNDVSFEITGGLVGIIGPNGAGKTTLLRNISGYYAPSAGRILLDGRPVRDYSAAQRAKKMALVPQNNTFDYDFTVLEMVLMGRNPHKKMFESDDDHDFEIARKCLAQAGIAHLEQRSVLTLSGGEWQRMLIARALCKNSHIMLLDEPVSSLDIRHQVGILNLVHSLTGTGKLCGVCVLHDLTLTYNYCSSVILLKQGRVYLQGPPKEVLSEQTVREVYDARVHFITQDGITYIMPAMLE